MRLPFHPTLLALLIAAPAAHAAGWPDGQAVEIGGQFGQYGNSAPVFHLGTTGTFWVHANSKLVPGDNYARSSSGAGEVLSPTENLVFYPTPPTGGFAADALGNLFYLRQPVSGTALELGGWTAVGSALPTSAVATGKLAQIGPTSITGAGADGGGAWFLWPQLSGGGTPGGPRLLRVTAAGGIATGWPASGWRLASSGVEMQSIGSGFTRGLLADGQGGAFVLLIGSVARVVRVTGDTTFAPGWPAGGLVLSSLPNQGPSTPSLLLPSGPDHALAVWSDASGFTACQRFAFDGTLDPDWPQDGIVLDASIISTVFADGQGGAYFLWDPGTGWVMRHLLANGQLPGAPGDPPLAIAPSNSKFAFAAGRAGGFVVVRYGSGSPDLVAHWFDGAGAPDPGPGTNESVLLTNAEMVAGSFTPHMSGDFGACPDGAGGVYVAWGGGDGTLYDCRLFTTHAPWPGDALLGAPLSAPSSLALRLAGANPVHGAVQVRLSLPGPGGGTLELLDVQGRALRRWDAGSVAGERNLALDGLGALAPGVYLLRLSHAGEARLARIAVVR